MAAAPTKQHNTATGVGSAAAIAAACACAPAPCCPRKCERLAPRDHAGDDSAAPPPLDALPDSLVQQHLLPHLGWSDKKAFRLANSRQRDAVNQCVLEVRVSGDALARAAERGARLGGKAFPAARVLRARDGADEPVTDARLAQLLSAAGPLLRQLREVDLKRCHHVTPATLALLRGACPALRRLAPSRWSDAAALAEVARFGALEELDLGDAGCDVVTVDALALTPLAALAPTLRRLSLARCRWVGDAAFDTIERLTGLEELDLSHTDVGARGLAALAALPNLRALDLSGCRCVGDDALAALAGALGDRLRRLALRCGGEGGATSAGLAHLAGCAALEELDLGPRWEVDDTGLAALARVPQLRSLTVGSFNLLARPPPPPPSGGKAKAAAAGLQRLEHLSFGGGFANKGLALLFPALRLRSLHVAGIDSATDAVLRCVGASQQRGLERLALRGGYALTPAGLAHLGRLARLSALSVSACPAIGRAALAEFAAAHARLGGGALVLREVGACPLVPGGDAPALCALAPEVAAALAPVVVA